MATDGLDMFMKLKFERDLKTVFLEKYSRGQDFYKGRLLVCYF